MKAYGTKKLVEGAYKKGDRVLLVDDVIMTGGTLVEDIPVSYRTSGGCWREGMGNVREKELGMLAIVGEKKGGRWGEGMRDILER